MNLARAYRISLIYDRLIEDVKLKIQPPAQYTKPSHVFLDQEGSVVAIWSRYLGCGESETTTTYHSLSDFYE